MKRVLVVGIGNILLRDEGVGVHVVEAMRGMALPDDVEVADGGTSGADLVDFFADRPKVIIVDAVRADGKPGSIYRMGPDDLMPDEAPALSIHQLGLLDSLIMARQLGCMPREVVIFGIQPVSIETGLELTEEIRGLVPKVIELVLEEAGKP